MSHSTFARLPGKELRLGHSLKAGRRLPAVLVLITVASTSCGSNGRSSPEGSQATAEATPEVGPCQPLASEGAAPDEGGLPALLLPCLGEGPDVDLSRLTGPPTLVNLWASWCGPCREEMPLIENASKEYGDEIRFLGVVTRDDPAVAADFASAIGAAYPHAVDAEGTLLDSVGVPGLPVTLGIDPTGRVVARQVGQMDESELSSLIAELQRSVAGG
ncbi:TlpA family protein disulfide reductase [Blastococcus sp. TF02-8]|uniref:TlpA family protein disulfide reductase n=1 Tax=Blastococcus sp. TF02-8 TaxID=2250574 RepID=UPI000DE8C7E1|nr:TlpA disulfide reductase family protein [Blastococcus sp. TF02-8]RBY97534.1 TlpA family protein disulfide reductase [Blastococcus sp. TF02-8]